MYRSGPRPVLLVVFFVTACVCCISFSLGGTSKVFMYQGESFFASVLSSKCDNNEYYYYYSHHHSLTLNRFECVCVLTKLLTL